jgi:ubiquinone/menaquinone biosynthesis C-methylase UbiE
MHCAGCKVDFPEFDGLPWLFAEPNATWHEWRSRYEFMLANLNRDRERSAETLASDKQGLLASTRTRLEQRIAANAAHIETLESLLTPLAATVPDSDIATYLALRTRLPPDQGLLTYYSNVHRDWAWGEEENEASLLLLARVIGAHVPRRMLVLGSGAGRLTYDLHQHYRPERTIGLDFNPLLVGIAARLTRGEELQLREFPIAPRSVADYGIEHELSCPTAAEGLAWVLGDTHRPPFGAKSFDTIVTPWLIDIIPERLESFLSRLNHLLTDDGVWINFGSLSFTNADPALQYSLDECCEIIEQCGFDAPTVESRTMKYLNSPASRHGRSEEVLAWSARKIRHEKKLPRYEALPDWVVRGNIPVPLTQGVRTQAMSSQVHGFLLSLIDGRRTLHDIAKIAVERRLLQPQDAEVTIRNFLIKMADESRRMGY